ncbi:uncharacterized protein LOC135348603 [Halichondria panicea]|uniref:uncharacterized protein LOC135348603 n=1 Tax=Halichondria panicea TaxID=6063 RepID=UPI00312B2EB3
MPCSSLNVVHSINSSMTLLFQEGTHVLTKDIILTGLENVSLMAYQGAMVTIQCGPQVRLLFQDMANLTIDGIEFIECGAHNNASGITFSNLTGSIANIRVTNSFSGAVNVSNSSINFINITIDNNRINSTSTTSFSAMKVINSNIEFAGTTLIAGNEILQDNEMELTCGIGTYEYTVITSETFSCINSTVTVTGTLTVSNNTSPSGTMNFENSNFQANGVSNFNHNTVCLHGALSLIQSNATFYGETNFLNNNGSLQYYPGLIPVGAVSLRDSILLMNGSIDFSGNQGDIATIEAYTSSINIHGSLMNSQNYATYSGTMLRANTNMTVSGNITFRDNNQINSLLRAESSNFTSFGDIYFTKNFGYPPCHGLNSFFSFNGVTTFKNNPGVARVFDTTMTFKGNSTFSENNVRDFTVGGAISLIDNSELNLYGFYLFERNRLADIEGGAIYSDNGYITFEGHGRFIENVARRGGALYLRNNQNMQLEAQTILEFIGNSATEGGAIFVYSSVTSIDCIITTDREDDCFVDFNTEEGNQSMTFENNDSTKGGSILHVKFVEEVDLVHQKINSSTLNTFSRLPTNGNSQPLIASDSFQLCFCDNDLNTCNTTERQIVVSRGEKITVRIKAISLIQNKAMHIRSYLQSSADFRHQSLDGDIQHLEEGCTDLEYRVKSTGSEEYITICADISCEEVSDVKLVLHLIFEDCPLGFAMNSNRTECICDQTILMHSTEKCNIDSRTITKTDQNFWIGEQDKDTNKSMIFYKNCPLDYCTAPPVEVHPSLPDTQCRNNRSGVLCGGCKESTSLVLGASKCGECSTNYNIFLIILFAILGILLVAFLFLTQLTVSSGTIHGLILYASIMNANSAIFGLQDVRVITVFLEGLNLNFGIETCFYMGLNQLQYTGWQFVFPIYLWLLVGLVIAVCHFSVRASRFFSNTNPVAVLATVIFLSYTKLLQNVIIILSAAQPDYPANATQPVWIYDGNVVFGQGGHAVLIAVGLFALILLFLPYTFVLLFAKQLEKNRHVSRLLNRLRLTPFIQAYQAPYKSGSRYWVGLCLFLRLVLLVTIGTSGNESISLLATSSVCILIVSIIGISGGIYTKRWLDALEISYILNLGLLTVTTYHLKLTYQPNERMIRKHVIGYISITVSLITFIGVVTKQCYTRLMKTQQFMKAKDKLIRKRSMDTELTDFDKPKQNNSRKVSVVTSTEMVFTDDNLLMELREPMLDYIS